MSKGLLQEPDAEYAVPFVYRRRVRFADSDAAQIIYTVRLFDYAMEALEGWFDQVADHDWYHITTERGMGTPIVHVEMDMRATLRPGDVVDVAVLVTETGRSSIRFSVVGRRDADGVVAFESAWVCTVIDKKAMKPIPIPADFQHRIDLYRHRCDAAKPDS